MVPLTSSIFKAYDIRGIVGKTLDIGIARQIGQAFGTAVRVKGERSVVIGRDGRLSGPELSAALASGLQRAGIDVIDLGIVATPMLYYATCELDAPSGIMVTGSHNPTASRWCSPAKPSTATPSRTSIAPWAATSSNSSARSTAASPKSADALSRIQQDFKRAILAGKPDAVLPF